LSFCNTIETRNDVRNREQCTHTQSWRDYADKRKKEQRIGIVPACRGEGQHMDHCLLRRGMRGWSHAPHAPSRGLPTHPWSDRRSFNDENDANVTDERETKCGTKKRLIQSSN
jgi:hypothetical protein